MFRVSIAAFAVMGTAALAQVSTLTADRPDGPDNDPNRIVCVREIQTGSRVGARRVCRTRAEWAQLRDQMRSVIERVQFNKQTCGNGSCVADPRLGGN